MPRAIRLVLLGLAVFVVAAMAVVIVLSGTYYGRERVRRLVLDALRENINGEIIVGRIEGNLLDRFDLVDVSIVDADGQPFLVADRVRARLAVAPLLSQRVIVRSLELHQPVVTLSKTPGGAWNYQRIFDSGDTLTTDVRLGFGSWVDLHNVTIRDGTVFVHQPYPSDDEVRRTVGDSAAFALAEKSRLRVQRVGYGLRQTMEFRDIDARIPRLVVADPDSVAIAFRVRQLSMEATPLQAPDVVVREMESDVRILEDTVALRDIDLRLPASRFTGELTYHVSAGDVELELKSDTLSFKDIQTLYPDLPDEGGGRLDLQAVIRDTATSEYEFTNARLSVKGSRVAGRLGMAVRPEMIELRETDLRFTRFSTELVESLVPGLRVSIPGAFTGRARLSGPPDALRTDVNGTYDPVRHAPFDLTARGIIGTGEVTRAQDLRVHVGSLPVSLLREFIPDMPLGGTATVDALVSGSTDSRFSGRATVTHRDAATSTIVANGSISARDDRRMNLSLRFTPVSLELAERFAPNTDFRGVVRGTGTVQGTLRDLRATLALDLPAGALRLDGTFDLQSSVRKYHATTQVRGVNLQAMVPALPVTALNGVATVEGRGTTTRTMDARLTVHLRDAVIDSTQLQEAVLVAAARDGRATVDTLRARTPFAVATATGTFGLIEGVSGTLQYDIDLTTLAGLQRWIATNDTTTVSPRPLVRQRIARAGISDTIRASSRGDTSLASLLARGRDPRRPIPLPDVKLAQPLGRDSIAGSARVRGSVTGTVTRFTAEGSAAIDHLVWDGYEVGRGTADYTWADVRTPDARLTASLQVDSVRAAGFALDSTHVEGTYRAGMGDVAVQLFPGDTARYSLRARYALHTDHGELHLQDVNLQFDSVAWRSTRESTIRWRGRGVEIDSLELRSGAGRGQGRIFVHGEMPDRDPGRLDIRLEQLRIGPWATLLQTTVPVDGIGSVSAVVDGTRLAPRISGTVALTHATFQSAQFPEFHSAYTYADRRLQFDGHLRREGGATSLARLTGNLPIDLSMGEGVTNRKVAGPITIDLEGDSIPLGPLSGFSEEITVLTGEVRGRIGLRGTWDRIRYDGAIALNVPRLGLRTPGIILTNATGRLHMVGDRLVIDSLVAWSEGPIRATGSLALTDIERPVLDVTVVATEARVVDNEKGSVVVSSRLEFKGPVDTVAVDGRLVVMHGVIRIPDPEQWNVINTGDPTLFAIADSMTIRKLELEPPSPLLKNADVNVMLQVRRGTWARSREANIEVFGDLLLERATGDAEFSVKGALHSDYGDYELYGRRFAVTRGTVRFTGPQSNPVLQLLATHEVRQAGRAPFDIEVTIGGTLEQPNISLQSQAQPTLTQSDLIAFLAFGKSSTSLLQFDGSGLEGGGLAGSSLAGTVAALASQQLGGVALGALLAELETSLSERTAVDVLRIRPAELPPGLSINDFQTLARGTQIEVGKYLDRNTFFVGQFRSTFAVPGATLERRFGTQFRARTSLETRYQPLTPSLTSGLQPKSFQVLAVLLHWTRSW